MLKVLPNIMRRKFILGVTMISRVVTVRRGVLGEMDRTMLTDAGGGCFSM